ncbi:RHS repeat-associated core domain-containing protein [Anaerostipes hadrus]|nr:RHS repeat-associated core domain-containing protein [Anaerostipes hadrus]
MTDKTWTDHAGNAVRSLSSGIYTDHVFTDDGKEIAAVTLGSSTDGEGKISLTLYNKEGKTTHTISQPVVDGDSITTGKDTIINETAYDVNGNESAVTDGNGNVTTYTYDAENRLSKVSVTDKDGKTAVIQQNRYNGDGQRIQKVEGSKTTNYYYQDGVVSYTTDGDNSQTSQNLIGTDGNILATQKYGSDHTDYLLYHKDIQGSSTSLVKEDGSADATYRYTDFGETTINGDNKAENEVCYTGGIYDQSTGLYYLNARYYNPEDGRFVTEDTYRGENDKPDTQHLYVYCANNPINHVDPSGHYAVALYTLVKVVAGGVVFYVSYSTWKRRRIKTRYAGRRVTFKTKISIWLTWRAANRIMHSKSKAKSNTKKKDQQTSQVGWIKSH